MAAMHRVSLMYRHGSSGAQRGPASEPHHTDAQRVRAGASRGFAWDAWDQEVHQQLDKVDQRMEQVDQKLDKKMDQWFEKFRTSSVIFLTYAFVFLSVLVLLRVRGTGGL
jgi:hypothetical protein